MGVEATESAGPGELHSTQHVPATCVLKIDIFWVKSVSRGIKRIEGKRGSVESIEGDERGSWRELRSAVVLGGLVWRREKRNVGYVKGGTEMI